MQIVLGTGWGMNRRKILGGLALSLPTCALLGARANANEVFEYDNLGRLIRVTYANGRVLSYGTAAA